MSNMNLGNPTANNILEKATTEAILMSFFEQIYDVEGMKQIEATLKNHLRRNYQSNQELSQFLNKCNNENIQNGEEIHNVIRQFCVNSGSMARFKQHTPTSLLELAGFFNTIGDCRLASECIWGSADMAIKNFVKDRGLNMKYELRSHLSKEQFIAALSPELLKTFKSIASYHIAFYTDNYNRNMVKFGIGYAAEFMNGLRTYGEISPEKKAELEGTDFNE